MMEQSAKAAVMIRPHRFFPNPETAGDNAFQREVSSAELAAVSVAAQKEFDRAAEMLRGAGINVHLFDDTISPEKPDAVFPNNWFSTHHDGRVAFYPMYSAARRRERRRDVIDELRKHYRVTEVIDYSAFEERGLYLEGTGSLVLDHVARLAYVSLSKRADREPLARFCADFKYEPVTFVSAGDDGRPIYHTNVVMCIGSEFALLGSELIADAQQRKTVCDSLEASGRRLIHLSAEQIANFAGNAIELRGDKGKVLVLSERALAALSKEQRAAIERSAPLLPLSLPTIELAGGSARCMLATIHLPPL